MTHALAFTSRTIKIRYAFGNLLILVLCCYLLLCGVMSFLYTFVLLCFSAPKETQHANVWPCLCLLGGHGWGRSKKGYEECRDSTASFATLKHVLLGCPLKGFETMLIESWSYRTDGLKSENEMQHQGKPRIGNMLLFISSLSGKCFVPFLALTSA